VVELSERVCMNGSYFAQGNILREVRVQARHVMIADDTDIELVVVAIRIWSWVDRS
jgi:hypothetical protein